MMVCQQQAGEVESRSQWDIYVCNLPDLNYVKISTFDIYK